MKLFDDALALLRDRTRNEDLDFLPAALEIMEASQTLQNAGPADLTKQLPDTPNVQTISPVTGKEIDTYYGCWLDMNQPTAPVSM